VTRFGRSSEATASGALEGRSSEATALGADATALGALEGRSSDATALGALRGCEGPGFGPGQSCLHS